MSLVNITKIVNLRLTADGYRLALLIAAKVVPVSGLCHCSNADFAAALGIGKSQVSRIIQHLCREGIVYRMNPRVVMVNPAWCFQGNPAEHSRAIQEWSRLHPLGLVKRQEETAA